MKQKNRQIRTRFKPETRFKVGALAPVFDLLFLARMIGELRRLRPDVVHTHAHHGRYWGRLAAVLAGVPLIVHTEHNSELRPPPPRALFDSLNRWLRRARRPSSPSTACAKRH